MIIGIDASRLLSKEPTGVERYAKELLSELLPLIGGEHTIRLYVPESFVFPFPLPSNAEVRTLRWPPKRLWTQFRLAYELFLHPPDVLFVPAHVPPWFVFCRVVLTVHDIASEHVPGAYSVFERWYARTVLSCACRRGYTILAPSRKTVEDVLSFAQKKTLPAPSIAETPLGISFAPITQSVHQNSSPFFLCVGRVEKKKQTDKTICIFSAWAALHPECTHRLLIVGKPGFLYEDAVRAREESPVKDRIVFCGFVSDSDMKKMYAEASLTFFLSSYEGFGFPVLESIVSGTPVLLTDAGSLRAFGFSGVFYTDPENVSGVIRDIERIVAEKKDALVPVAVREKIAREYSWVRTAKLTCKVLLHTT